MNRNARPASSNLVLTRELDVETIVNHILQTRKYSGTGMDTESNTVSKSGK